MQTRLVWILRPFNSPLSSKRNPDLALLFGFVIFRVRAVEFFSLLFLLAWQRSKTSLAKS